MKRETAKRLLDALMAAQEIVSFTDGKTIDDMWKDRGLQLSLHKLIEIVGEALNQANRIDPEIAAAIPDLRRIVDMRNRISHGYDSVDYGVIWQVSTEYVPRLLPSLDRLLESAPQPPGHSADPHPTS